MRDIRIMVVGVVGAMLLMFGSALAQDGKHIKQILLQGSPWRVIWGGGGFTQTFAETPDGKVKTTTDEIGPYETQVQFPNVGQAIWTSPHQRIIDIFVHQGRVVGTSRDGAVMLEYETRRR
jgi:hypothetical protein